MPDNGPYGAFDWPAYIEGFAEVWDACGDHARAVWIRSQAQEIAVCFRAGRPWREVFGL